MTSLNYESDYKQSLFSINLKRQWSVFAPLSKNIFEWNRGFSHRIKRKPRFPGAKHRHKILRLVMVHHHQLFERQFFTKSQVIAPRDLSENAWFWRPKCIYRVAHKSGNKVFFRFLCYTS